MKKYLVITLILAFIVGCNQSNNSTTRFFDNQNNLIFEFDGVIDSDFNPELLPEAYRDYLHRAIWERNLYLLKETGDMTQPFSVVDYSPTDFYLNIDIELQQDVYNESNLNDHFDNSIIQRNKTGEIIAFVDEGMVLDIEKYNWSESYKYTTRSSILDPIQYYARAFEHLEFSTADYINDVDTFYPGLESLGIKIISPDEEYLGIIPLKEALQGNRSSSYWIERKLRSHLGQEEYENYYESRKVYRNKTKYVHLGKVTNAEMVHQEYQMLFNEGVLKHPRFINEMIINGEKIKIPYTDEKILSKDAAYLTRELLHQDKDYISTFSSDPKYKNIILFNHAYYGNDWIDRTEEEKLYFYRHFNVSSTEDISIVTSQISTDSFEASSNDFPKTISNLTFRRLINELSSDEYQKPNNIKKTNYLPESIGEDNIDTHTENDTGKDNFGYSK